MEFMPLPKSDEIDACIRAIEDIKRQIYDAFNKDAKRTSPAAKPPPS